MALAQRFSERWGHQRCGQLQTRQACRGGIRFERGHTQPEAMEGEFAIRPEHTDSRRDIENRRKTPHDADDDRNNDQ